MVVLLYAGVYIITFHLLGFEQFFLVGAMMIMTIVRVVKGMKINPFCIIDFFHRSFSRENIEECLAANLIMVYFYLVNGYFNSLSELITYPFLTLFIYSVFVIDIDSKTIENH